MIFNTVKKEVELPTETNDVCGSLSVPSSPRGLIIFAHGSGSSRKSPRNTFVANELNQNGFATLLLDLLSTDEKESHDHVFDITLLSERLLLATKWASDEESLSHLPIGYFGASTGGAVALMAAAQKKSIYAVVCRGGRPDLVENYLEKVKCPVQLIVGGWDFEVLKLNKKALTLLKDCQLDIVPAATHLFGEVGALDKVIELSISWFTQKLPDVVDRESFRADVSA